MEQAFERYVNLYHEIMKRVNNSEAVALGIVQEMGKDFRLQAIQSVRSSAGKSSDSSVLATDKQKAFLIRRGVEFDETLSKSRASELIDSIKRSY